MYTFCTEFGRIAAIRRWRDREIAAIDWRMQDTQPTLANIRRMEQEQRRIRATAAKLIRTNAEVWITDDGQYGFRTRGGCDPP